MNWPESVPVLTADDVRTVWDPLGAYRHSIYWWLDTVFLDPDINEIAEIAVCARSPAPCRFRSSKLAAAWAAAWNDAMKSLGYTEIYTVEE